MSGGGKYFFNFKIGKRINFGDNGLIRLILIVDNNEEVIINRLVSILKGVIIVRFGLISFIKSSMFFFCVEWIYFVGYWLYKD